MVYSGEEQTASVKITLLEYNEKEFLEKEFTDFDECLIHVKANMVKWINVDGIHNTELIQKIGEKFGIHSLTLEDIASHEQRPKFEDYETYLVSIMKMLSYNFQVHSEQLSIILLDNNTVLSFQETNGGDAFDIIRTRIRQGKGRVRKMGADYLAYCLIDAVVDLYFVIIEKIGDRIEVLEEELLHDSSKETMKFLHAMKREMIFLRKAVWPMRELINNFERCENKLIKKTTRLFLRDLYDHTIRIIDTVETFRDLLSGMMDIYLSSVSNRMNEVMKVLTIITTIFIPLSFIAGVYGMNFDNMPELHSRYGYYCLWAVMITVAVGMVFYFKKRKWL
ncbi:MAG: magnesium/cobalt transporter CorA [Bacteroidota bacterium]